MYLRAFQVLSTGLKHALRAFRGGHHRAVPLGARAGGAPASGRGGGRGERSHLLCKVAGTENSLVLAVNVLAVNFWLLRVTVPSLLYIVSKNVVYTLYSGTTCLVHPM